MHSLRRTAVAAARPRRSTLSRPPRRHAQGHGHAAAAEPMGKGFYTVMAVMPAAFALHYLSRKDGDHNDAYLTRLISKATAGLNDKWTAQNDLHVRMVEQAGEDRVLFLKTQPVQHVEMKFPEIMNVGSPYNVPAGSQVDMHQVIAKYKKLAHEDNERKLEALRENRIKSEQRFDGKTRVRKARVGSKGEEARVGSKGEEARVGSKGEEARVGSKGEEARDAL